MFKKNTLTAAPILALILALPFSAFANNISVSGEVGIKGRGFFEEPPFNDQHPNRINISLEGKLEVYKDYNNLFSDGDNLLIKATPKGRIDLDDSKRNLIDFEEAKLDYQINDWQFVAGIDKIFWGVTESRHLVDIINQTDGTEDVDGEEKLGQPMLSATYYAGDYGNINLFYLPIFRELNFIGNKGRLRPGFVIDKDSATYENNNDEFTPSFAGRYSNVFGNFDIGISHFSGLSREAIYSQNAAGSLIPKYNYIEQSGLDLQYTSEGLLLKLEAINRSGHGDRFTAATGGFEYTFYDVAQTGYDIGTLAEYHYDGRDKDLSKAPFTLTDDDLFLGTRITLNDANDTTFLGGAIIDLNTSNVLYNAEYSQRLGGIISDNYKLEVDARYYDIADDTSFESIFADESHVQLSLKRYF